MILAKKISGRAGREKKISGRAGREKKISGRAGREKKNFWESWERKKKISGRAGRKSYLNLELVLLVFLVFLVLLEQVRLVIYLGIFFSYSLSNFFQ